MPGDDAGVVNHLKGTLASNATAGNGRIEGQWNSTKITDETALFWQHIRLAGMATGSTNIANADYFPRNSVGGRLGIQSAGAGFSEIENMTGTYIVCSQGISGDIAKQIDTHLDDAETSTGAVRAVVDGNASAVAAQAIDDASAYTVCMAF